MVKFVVKFYQVKFYNSATFYHVKPEMVDFLGYLFLRSWSNCKCKALTQYE